MRPKGERKKRSVCYSHANSLNNKNRYNLGELSGGRSEGYGNPGQGTLTGRQSMPELILT